MSPSRRRRRDRRAPTRWMQSPLPWNGLERRFASSNEGLSLAPHGPATTEVWREHLRRRTIAKPPFGHGATSYPASPTPVLQPKPRGTSGFSNGLDVETTIACGVGQRLRMKRSHEEMELLTMNAVLHRQVDTVCHVLTIIWSSPRMRRGGLPSPRCMLKEKTRACRCRTDCRHESSPAGSDGRAASVCCCSAGP
jgi:hypothetical protein